MFAWLAAFFKFGLEPIKEIALPNLDLPPSQTQFKNIMENKNWPDGPQLRKEMRLFEPDGWAHSDWSWRSCGYVDHPGSLYPKVNKAECRHCLGVLECQTCGRFVRPSTKAADMKAQIARNCPNFTCCGELSWNTCDARTYHFAVEEQGSQYSMWEHTGHHSHPRPPAGRRPPRSSGKFLAT
jgi:hypothetical protein